MTPAQRSFFEPRFNHDFGDVRVHTGVAASASAHAIKARAFTVGRDIAFGAGEYAPESRSGRRLLAHELTHTIQQTPLARTKPLIQRQPETSFAEGGAPDHPGPQSPTPVPVEEPEQTAAGPEPGPETPAPGLIVGDETTELGPGQMGRRAFLAELRSGVCAAADEPLAGTQYTGQGCPTIEFYLRTYDGFSAERIERDLVRFMPEAAGITDAREYIPLMAARVRRSVELWVQTGEITGVPEGLPTGLPGLGLLAGILFKARNGGPRGNPDPRVVQTRLGTGRPMNSSVSSRMGSTFGRSFSNVRVHTDGTAAQLTDRFNARAFTVGNHVAFGAGEYRPGTLMGDALIAHELAHAVQQRNANTSVAAMQPAVTQTTRLEKDADRSAVGAVASLWGGAKAGIKDIATSTIPRLRSGLSLQRCQTRTGKTTTATPQGQTAGAKTADAAKLAKAKEPILKTFKVKSIVDGNASWTVAELVLLNDALKMVPSADRSSLEGVEIRRVISVGSRTKGLFESDVSEVPKGTTTFTEFKVMKLANGVFSGGNKAEAKRLIIHEVAHAIAAEKRHKAAIARAEAGVEQNKKAAISKASKVPADEAHEQVKISTRELNAKIREHNRERDPTKKAELKKQVEQLRAQDKAKKAARATITKQNKADIAAENAAAKITAQKAKVVASLTISAKELKNIKRSASAARKSHDRQRKVAQRPAGRLDKTDADVREFHDAVFRVSDMLESFHDDTKSQDKTVDQVDTLVIRVEKSIAARDAAKSALSTSGKAAKSMTNALAGLVAAQDGLFHAAKAHSLAHKRGRLEQEFVKFVTKKKIAPITPYAAKNWPHRPGEFYAEAYSFWVTGKLKAVSADLQGWFDAGKHK